MFASLLTLLPYLATANAFFIIQSKILQTTRLDPIVDPGAISGHVHTIAGGSGFGQSVTYESMRASRCTTAPVTEDKSNYWIPQLYHYDPSDESYTMVPVDFMNAYYLPRPGKKDKKVYAFPDGLRMISGDPGRRDFDRSDPNDLAITYVCLEFSGAHRGNPDWDQRNSFFPHNECPQGMRAQVNFPNCWDGVNLDSPDHKSHMAWPSGGVDGGDCPASHPVHLVSLFYEFIFQVQGFDFNGPDAPTFVWANGDTTGYALHADFINGWPSLVNGTNILQRAIDECNINDGVGGVLKNCPPFVPFLDNRAADSCQPENPIVNEDIGDRGKIFSLPGDNPLYTGPGMVTGNSTNTDPEPGLVNTTSPLPAGWSRTGCIAEPSTSGARALLAASYTSDNMTRGACANFCASKSLPIAGVEFGRECYCDSQIRNGATNRTILADSQCGYTCSGSQYENCGGARTLELMVNPSFFQAGPVLPAGWAAAGCRTEATSGRALNGYSFSASNMTNEICTATCASRGFTIAGTEYSRECYCGNSFNAGSVSAAATQCNMVCGGNSGQTCGGGSRLSVFTGPAVSSSTASSASSTASSATSSAASSNTTSVASSTTTSAVSSTTSSASSTTSSTSTTSPSPAASPLPSGWTANGCFADANPRVLGGYSFSSSSMTTELCLNTCYSRGFLFAGTQYASECYCGNDLSTANSAPESSCNMACKGNAGQTCGGPTRLTTYKSNIQATAAGAPAGWSALGCLTDSGNARTFDGYRFTSDSMNYTLCTSTCASRGFNFAGIQYARECYCGNTQGGSTAATSDCSMNCAGDMYSKCGGSWRLTAFKSNTNNTVPATTTTATTATAATTTTAASATTTSAAAVVPAAPSGWTTVGCWTDQGNPRSLNGYKYSSGTAMTYESCTAACGQRNFLYAGIEYGGECFCDNTLAGSAAPAGECNMGCSGDKTQPCGGSWRMNVFKAATAAPAATSAAVSTLPAGWTNVGCNADKPSNRVINGLRLTANNMTWNSCISQCASRGYWYAGVEYASECYCGFAATLSAADQSSCNMKCSGDSSINCGGPDRIQVFYNAEAEAKGKSSASSLPGNWKAYGCVVDSVSARALQPYRTTNGQMSYNLCAQTCQANGYSYAGVEYGNECYCGNEPKIQDATSGCNMACAGDPASMCGGASRMNLFYNGDLVASPPVRSAPARRSLVKGGVRLQV